MKAGFSILAILTCLLLFAQAQPPQKKSYTEISEVTWLPKYSILSILQDHKGFLWVGTNSGLFSYNGSNVSNYSFTHSEKNTFLNNTIKDIVEDKLGNIWIATGSGLGVIQTDPYKIKLVIAESIQDLEVTADGNIWVAVNNSPDVLYRVDPLNWEKNKVLPFFSSKRKISKITGENVKAICPAAGNKVWIGSEKGLFLLDPDKKQIEQTNFNTSVSRLLADKRNILWVGSESSGIFAVKPETNKKSANIEILKHYNLGNPNEASFNKITVLTALQGNFIVGGTFNHLYLSNLSSFPGSEFYQPEKIDKIFYDSSIYSILADREQNIWVGTLHGLYKLKNQHYLFERIKLSTADYIPINNQVLRLSSDKKDNIWIVSNNDGLFKYLPSTGSVERISVPHPDQLKNFFQTADGSYLVNIGANLYRYRGKVNKSIKEEDLEQIAAKVNGVQVILEDKPGIWWLGTWNDGLKIAGSGDKEVDDPFFRSVAKQIDKTSHISCMIKDRDGTIWIGHRGRGLIKADRKTNTVSVYHSGKKGLLSDRILSIYSDKNGNVWIATRGQGVQLYDKKSDTFKTFSANNGLPSNTICAFGEDRNGSLWVASQNGLAKFLPGQPIPFQSYGPEDGISHTEFSFNASVTDRSGRLYFGNSDGVYTVDPNQNANFTPKGHSNLIITGFNLLNHADSSENKLTNLIGRKEVFELPYRENSFIISFSSLNFTSPEKIKYAYRLKGYDEEWQYTNSSHKTVQYLNVPSGDYSFEVKCTDNEGFWNPVSVSFAFAVNPPFLLSPAAYIIYFIIFCIAISLAIYLTRRWYKLNHKLQEETATLQLQAQQMVYFSDLSHEIKNRLTLILGPLETALTGKKVNKAILNNLYEQAQRLKRINEQIINIRKSESGEFLLNAERGDMKAYLTDICEKIKPLALVRNIELDYVFDSEKLIAFFDKEIIEIILLNLITNAIKYSEPGGLVLINLESKDFPDDDIPNKKAGKYICCSIKDTGIGISEEELSKVTKPFFRTIKASQNMTKEGSGIGLNLVQRLIERHHGWMDISSKEHEFTSVTFFFPAEEHNYEVNEIRPSLDNTLIVELQSPEKSTVTKPSAAELKPKILIVDDEADIRNFLRSSLEGDFEIIEAQNGEIAYQYILANNIELVVSDLSMPMMDGISLLKKIKNSSDLNDIPVVILTGKNSENEKLLCLENNADDFIEKPFSPELLRWRIRNLLANRQNLKAKYSRKIELLRDEDVNILSPDEKFIQEIVGLIEKNISDPNLNVETLADRMCMSRATLYRKMEELLSESPSLFIRKFRLKKAANLLKTGKFYVSQVSYMVGVKNPKHFTQSFHREYGITPTEYIKLQKDNELEPVS